MIIVTQLRNESQRIIEWILYHANEIGIRKFIIFDDHSDDETLKYLDLLKDEFNIEVFKTIKASYYSDSKNPEIYGNIDLHKRILNSMNEGLNLLKKNNIGEWVFFIEVDEFIKPDFAINDYLSTIPENINRIWIPSYDFSDDFIINNKILSQSVYRWSDNTRNATFKGRCKSALRITEQTQNIVCIHNLDFSDCVRTSGTDNNNDNKMARQDTKGIKLFHYRKPSLFSNFDEYDDSLKNINFDVDFWKSKI